MTHVEFEYHFAKEAERFGISKLIRENNKDYDFQSFMLSLSGIVARNEPIDEKELETKAAIYADAYYKKTDEMKIAEEAFKAGYWNAKRE